MSAKVNVGAGSGHQLCARGMRSTREPIDPGRAAHSEWPKLRVETRESAYSQEPTSPRSLRPEVSVRELRRVAGVRPHASTFTDRDIARATLLSRGDTRLDERTVDRRASVDRAPDRCASRRLAPASWRGGRSPGFCAAGIRGRQPRLYKKPLRRPADRPRSTISPASR